MSSPPNGFTISDTPSIFGRDGKVALTWSEQAGTFHVHEIDEQLPGSCNWLALALDPELVDHDIGRRVLQTVGAPGSEHDDAYRAELREWRNQLARVCELSATEIESLQAKVNELELEVKRLRGGLNAGSSEGVVGVVHGILRDEANFGELGWDRANYLVGLVGAAEEYREACFAADRIFDDEDEGCVVSDYEENCRDALLDHAYNGGKAP